MTMMANYLTLSISIAFISWLVGLIINPVLKKTTFYNNHLSNLNFIESENLNKIIGLEPFKWIVKNTFLKFFNPNINLKKKIKINIDDLNYLQSEMTSAENGHLIGLVFVGMFTVVFFLNSRFSLGLTITIVNILMNLYPMLLQQENKRRLSRLKKILLQTGNLPKEHINQ